MKNKASGLQRVIFSHYARSALIPILTIELLLVVIYFSVNTYTNHQAESMLRSEVMSVMPHLAQKQAELIDANFRYIALSTSHFAKENAALFADPKSRGIIGERPEFDIAPTGALYQTNRSTETSLYFSHAERLSSAQKEKARFTAALDPLYRHMVEDIPNVAAAYLNTHDDMNRLFPFIPEVYKQYPPDLHMEDYNFYYLADAKHDPGKKPVWTGVYLDPAGNGWMLSCVAPVYRKETLEGVVGLDVTVNDIVEKVLSEKYPWGATAFLADDRGMILAMLPQAEKILGLTELKEHVYNSTIAKEQLKPEEYNLLKNRNSFMAKTFKQIYDTDAEILSIAQKGAEDLFVVNKKIDSTGWKLFVLIESDQVLKSANAVAALSSQIGLALVLSMFIFYAAFFTFLRRRAKLMSATIAAPVALLSAAAKKLGRVSLDTELPTCGIEELDELTGTFSQMAGEIEMNSKALIQSEVRSKIKEKESELAFARGMFESASGYLHNVGNSITRLDSSLLDLDNIVRSTEQYPDVFARIASGDTATLERFRHVLLDKTLPKIRETVLDVRKVKETIQQTIRHQQQSFKESRAEMSPERFDLAALVRSAAEGVAGFDAIVSLRLDLPEVLEIVHHRNQLYDGILNLIKNAAESCRQKGGGTVEVTLRDTGKGANLTVKDNGMGVRPEHIARLMSAGFTTKQGGNGFGLHSLAVFLSGHNGRLTIESPGPGQGATVVVEVEHV
ncbi:MAG: ATP-binding protein [Spirochaetota bacterium]